MNIYDVIYKKHNSDHTVVVGVVADTWIEANDAFDPFLPEDCYIYKVELIRKNVEEQMKFNSKEERIGTYIKMISEHMDCPEYAISFETLDEIGFFTAPASRHYHGAYEGGLFDHSYTVAMELMNLTKKLNLEWENEVSPILVGFYHDLCKCDLYKFVDGRYEYNPDADFTEHGGKSVRICEDNMTLTNEEKLCIRYHMGAYEVDDWAKFDKAISRYPNVLYTHTADMIASKVDNC